MKPLKNISLCIIAISTVIFSACNEQIKTNGDVSYYLIDVTRAKSKTPVDTEKILIIRRFEIASRFRTTQLVYRTSNTVYETDSYNMFLTRPEQAVAEETRKWLSNASIFKSVVNRASVAESSYNLEANITEMYGDFRDQNTPKAVLAIRFFLIDTSGRNSKLVFDKAYEVAQPLAQATASDLIIAYGQALTSILQSLENDLRNTVTGR